ncbi:hypothetical protein [Thalassoglobus sp.]|uniref:hypothetical protein n=1 Tax=Thalassoglobus sp. TaxID=2795869 RepID=UPI003AA83470
MELFCEAHVPLRSPQCMLTERRFGVDLKPEYAVTIIEKLTIPEDFKLIESPIVSVV